MEDERVPCGVVSLVIPFAVEFFDIQILHVAVERSESPCDVLIVAGGDEGHSGKRDACRVKAGRMEIRHVPGVWLAEREMHIVREERLAAGGVSASDDPVIR